MKLKTLLHFLCLSAPLGDLAAGESPKPNIVFIYADDWGWGDLSCHGSTWLKTPNIDRLASQGIDFQQFNVLSSVCSPSRVAAKGARKKSGGPEEEK
jgi:N-acetylgalactosamine-6-sulfatase